MPLAPGVTHRPPAGRSPAFTKPKGLRVSAVEGLVLGLRLVGLRYRFEGSRSGIRRLDGLVFKFSGFRACL